MIYVDPHETDSETIARTPQLSKTQARRDYLAIRTLGGFDADLFGGGVPSYGQPRHTENDFRLQTLADNYEGSATIDNIPLRLRLIAKSVSEVLDDLGSPPRDGR